MYATAYFGALFATALGWLQVVDVPPARPPAALSTYARSVDVHARQELTPPAPTRPAWSKHQLQDIQGDLMIWAPEVGCQSPQTGIKCDTRGLKAGWMWSLSIPRYSAAHRARLYDAVLKQGYSHVAIQVSRCEIGPGYHDLYPVADCAGHDAQLNTVLRELVAKALTPICAGVSPGSPVAPGLDKSLCPIAMNDWDNSAQADCRIKAVAETFPAALVYYELPHREITPKPDACSPVPFPDDGSLWLKNVRQKYPNFTGVLFEVDQPDGLDSNVAELTKANAWWHDVQQVLFETDTYWKFWSGLGMREAVAYNDALRARTPWLHGFMSGGTPHPR